VATPQRSKDVGGVGFGVYHLVAEYEKNTAQLCLRYINLRRN
jgi:hypothetical protein